MSYLNNPINQPSLDISLIWILLSEMSLSTQEKISLLVM
jgi:hypothetical protein